MLFQNVINCKVHFAIMDFAPLCLAFPPMSAAVVRRMFAASRQHGLMTAANRLRLSGFPVCRVPRRKTWPFTTQKATKRTLKWHLS